VVIDPETYVHLGVSEHDALCFVLAENQTSLLEDEADKPRIAIESREVVPSEPLGIGASGEGASEQ
jgi:hypothetical protein